MTQRDPMAVLVEHGMLLEPAKGPLPNAPALLPACARPGPVAP